MKWISLNRMHPRGWLPLAAPAAVLFLAWSPGARAAQATDPTHARPAAQSATTPSADPNQALLKQIAELRAQVAQLKTLVEQQNPTSPKPAPAMGGTAPAGMMDNMMEMMSGMDKAEMAGMAGGGMASGGASGGGMMKMDKGEMGMPPPEMMMEMGGMGTPPKAGGTQMGGSTTAPNATAMTMPQQPAVTTSLSALPGVPGASHVYHIGSTGFFLDQPQLKLSADQQTKLAQIKERAVLARATSERQIEQAEQELWALTGAGQPDATKIQPKLQEIEQQRTAQRLAFITAVGDATSVLTPEQRDVILGIKK